MGEAAIRLIITEGILFAVLMLALYGCRTLIKDAEVAKWVTLIVILAIGGYMLIVLLRFANVV